MIINSTKMVRKTNIVVKINMLFIIFLLILFKLQFYITYRGFTTFATAKVNVPKAFA